MRVEDKVKQYLKSGVYDQNKIFAMIYPEFKGHYSHLRNIISEVKNNA